MRKILIVVIVVFVLIAAGLVTGFFFLLPKIFIAPTPVPVACTMEAKLCPDGSYVGRSGPKCEFAPCPPEVVRTETGWKTFNDPNGAFRFQYPETLTTKYIDAFEWPPKVTVSPGVFSCAETSPASSLPEFVARRTVDSRVYCVESIVEGAAGSTYTTYTYTTEHEGKLISPNFVIRYPQCGNYDDPQKTECQNEREAFDLDGVIDRIVATLQFTNTGTVSGGSGVTGSVLLGPTCPVERIPPDPACADKPYQTNLEVTTVEGSQIVKEFSSGTDGKFSVDLPPGEYAIQPVATSNVYPRCATLAFTVAAGVYTDVTINCDTGIR